MTTEEINENLNHSNEETGELMSKAVNDVIDIFFSDSLDWYLKVPDANNMAAYYVDLLQTFIDSNNINRYELRERVRLKINERVEEAYDIPFVTELSFDHDGFNEFMNRVIPLKS